MINNTFNSDWNSFISYELGVMIGVSEESPTSSYLVDSIERISHNEKLHLSPDIVASGIRDYFDTVMVKYDSGEIRSLLYWYGLTQVE